jgi:hypothetical protein
MPWDVHNLKDIPGFDGGVGTANALSNVPVSDCERELEDRQLDDQPPDVRGYAAVGYDKLDDPSRVPVSGPAKVDRAGRMPVRPRTQ